MDATPSSTPCFKPSHSLLQKIPKGPTCVNKLLPWLEGHQAMSLLSSPFPKV